MLGPVSSASPNGGGPFWNTLVLLVSLFVLGGAWRAYLRRGRDVHIPRFNIIWITAVGLIMIAFSIYGFLH